MDYLPKELYYQIMYYLDIQDIETLDEIFPRLSESEYFWNEYLVNNQIKYTPRDSIKGYYQKFVIGCGFPKNRILKRISTRILDKFSSDETMETYCNIGSLLNIPSTLINRVKIGALYHIIANIQNIDCDILFRFTKNLLTIGINNPLLDAYIMENLFYKRKYLELHEDKTFKKYKIDLSKDFIIFDTIEITKKDVELILFTIDNI